jgi:MraZ protein
MFLGTYQNTIDNKNRMIVPAKFRDQLGGKCMLTKGFDECLYIYTMQDFEEMAAKLAGLPQSDADFREFIRDFFGNSVLCELDSQGRILIPQNLRDYAHITKDLVTTGAMNKVEIWSAETREDFDMAGKMKDSSFTDKLREFSI